MFRLELLPAEFGDALWIEYGKKAQRRRVLIDCGTKGVYERIKQRIDALSAKDRRFELFVVTHVDIDHIGGAVDLLRSIGDLGVEFRDIWFNGYVHLDPGGRVPPPEATDILGPLQGEELTELIAGKRLPWNRAFGGRAVVVPDSGGLPSKTLEGGLKLTLLSPFQKQLDRLKPVWGDACRKAKIAPGAPAAGADDRLGEAGEDDEEDDDLLGEIDVPALAAREFKADTAKPNGTSIALLAEYAGKRLLLAADAYAPVLLQALPRLPGNAGGKLKLDGFKLSHHGSRKNTNVDLVKAVSCPRWFVSTNGKQFKHPNLETVARVIQFSARKPALHFNYRTTFNEDWDSAQLQKKHKYSVGYPSSNTGGIVIDLA